MAGGHTCSNFHTMSDLARTDQLEGWKVIASYLKVDVSTAKRWEKEGLPVHRLQHAKMGRIFAYPSELDQWMRSRTDAQPPPANTPVEVAPMVAHPRRRRRFWPAALTILAAGGVAVLFYRPALPDPIATPLSLGSGVREHPSLSPDGS